MWKLNISDIWPFHFTKIGRFWDSKTEIDSVKKPLSISFPDVHSTSMIFQYLQEPDSFWTLTVSPKWKMVKSVSSFWMGRLTSKNMRQSKFPLDLSSGLLEK